MRKLYTDVSLETPFMVSYNDVQTQACANDEDTITIGATEYIRLTDENGHNVSDREGNQLLLNDGVVYKVVSGVPESTNVQVTDVVITPQYTVTINPTPNNATVTLTAVGFSQVGNTITVDDGTTVSYTVSASGYTTASNTYTVNGADHTINVVLDQEPQVVRHTYTYYLNNGETASFTCSDEGATITNNTVSAAEGATITFSFSKTGYQTLSGTTTMGSSDEYVSVELVREGYIPAWAYMVSPEPPIEEIVYTIDYPPQRGDSVHDTLFTQTDVVEEIETTAGIVTAIKLAEDIDDGTYYRQPYSDMANPLIAVITVVPWPEDATVTLTAQGYTQQGNSITVDAGTQVSCQVTRTGFIGSQQTINADTTKTVNVNLDGYSITNPIDNTLSYDPNESLSGDYWLYYGQEGYGGQVTVYDTYSINSKYAQIRLSETPINMDNTDYYPVIANSGSELYPSHYTLYQPQGREHPMVLMVTSDLDFFYIWDVGTSYTPEIDGNLNLTIKMEPEPPMEEPME